jgi:hypothetical protein
VVGLTPRKGRDRTGFLTKAGWSTGVSHCSGNPGSHPSRNTVGTNRSGWLALEASRLLGDSVVVNGGRIRQGADPGLVSCSPENTGGMQTWQAKRRDFSQDRAATRPASRKVLATGRRLQSRR